MKHQNKFNAEPQIVSSAYSRMIKTLIVIAVIISAFILTTIQSSAQTQQYSNPSWYFGVVGAANANFYDGSTRQLSTEFTSPSTFHKGNGVGIYAGGLIQYRPANSVLGIMIQGGYDSRKGKFDQITTSCNCPADLSTKISYVTLEPSLVLAPFKNGFYIFLGPRMAFSQEKSFTYKLGVNPAFPNQAPTPDVTGEISNINKAIISGQIGMGYDFMMSSSSSMTKFVISPFVSYHPYFGQEPRSTETWNISTVRAGIALKLGSGHKILPPALPVANDKNVVRVTDTIRIAATEVFLDRDGDGIADNYDKCPGVFGYARYLGCPIPDSDKDGINDELDKCVTVYGLARYNGCPIPDTDGDGVNDEVDKCINEKGPASNYGCPLINKEIIDRVKLAEKYIFFETAKSTLLPKSFSKLNDVVSILQNNPSYKLTIDGHADYIGNDEYNQTLSEQRDASVKAYFISKGINANRITAYAHGEQRPMANNETVEGRAKNRRVEMTLRNY